MLTKIEPPAVYGSISDVMGHMAKEGISKDRRNQQQGYSFRGIDDVYNALGSVLAQNRLVMLPRVIDRRREERQTAKGGMLLYTILTVEFDLVSAKDGSMHTVCLEGEAMDSADKSSNKAQSAALKYAALQVFMIPTEGMDNDADATTHEVAAKGMPDEALAKLVQLVKDANSKEADICQFYGVSNLRDLDEDAYMSAVKTLEGKIAKAAKVKEEDIPA